MMLRLPGLSRAFLKRPHRRSGALRLRLHGRLTPEPLQVDHRRRPLRLFRPNRGSSPMSDRPRKTPGPDHPITVEPDPRRIVVTVAGKRIAESRHALALREATYPAVHYIPREDVDMAA